MPVINLDKERDKFSILRVVLAFLSPPLALVFAAVFASLVFEGMESICPKHLVSSGGCSWQPQWIREIPFFVFTGSAAFLWVVLPTVLARTNNRKIQRFFFTWGVLVSIFINYKLSILIGSFSEWEDSSILSKESIFAVAYVAMSIAFGLLGVKFCDNRLDKLGDSKEETPLGS
jgi:hypothetical protein